MEHEENKNKKIRVRAKKNAVVVPEFKLDLPSVERIREAYTMDELIKICESMPETNPRRKVFYWRMNALYGVEMASQILEKSKKAHGEITESAHERFVRVSAMVSMLAQCADELETLLNLIDKSFNKNNDDDNEKE